MACLMPHTYQKLDFSKPDFGCRVGVANHRKAGFSEMSLCPQSTRQPSTEWEESTYDLATLFLCYAGIEVGLRPAIEACVVPISTRWLAVLDNS